MLVGSRWKLASIAAAIGLASGGLYLFSVNRDLAHCLQTQAETRVAQRKQDLAKSIGSLEEEVSSLARMKLQLKGEIGDSELRRDVIQGAITTLEERRRQAEETLAEMEFEVVKAKIEAGAASSIAVENASLDLFYDIRGRGTEPRTEKLWPDFLQQVRRSAAGYAVPSEKNHASEFARAFEQQCRHLQDVQINIPALVNPEKGDPHFEQKQNSLAKAEQAISRAFSDALFNLQDCLHHVQRQ